MPKNNKPELRSGDKFNRLTILSYSHSDKRWRKWYNVKCECGSEKVVMGSAMTSGNTKSCGCYATKERQNRRISKNKKQFNIKRVSGMGCKIRKECYGCAVGW